MEDTVVLEWRYAPVYYFEDEFETNLNLNNEQYKMVVKKGKIEVHISSALYEKNKNIHNWLYDAINKKFKVFLLTKYEPLKISKSVSITGNYTNGKKHVIKFADTARVAFKASVRVVKKDKDGNVIYDSCKEQTEKNKELIDLISRCESKDSFAVSLLDCLYRATNNKSHELVHLYEIREALVNKFGNQQSARQSLGISRKDWSRLGELANDLPLKQGRHAGKKINELRDATSKELNEARQLAQRFVKAYLNYLDLE